MVRSPVRTEAKERVGIANAPPGPEPIPFVVFGDDWGRRVSTMQHLFRRILANHPVVWVNSFGHRVPQLTFHDARRAAAKVWAMVRGPTVEQPDAIAAGAPAAVIAPKALPWHNVRWVHAMNTALLVRDVRGALARLSLRGAPVVVTGTPAAAGVVGSLGERASIYFCMDNYAELPDVTRDLILPLERVLLAKVGAVVGTAADLTRSKRPASGQTFHLPQGVNYDHFATPQPPPPEVVALPRPRFGFAGGVSECCDLDLIRAVALAHPEGSVVLVGPVQIDVSGLALPNIHILGMRPYTSLPAYVQTFDVGIIPYLLNEWTRAVDPLKLLEYLAAGVPVVSTPIPEVLKYASAVTLASTPDEFAAAAALALAGDTPDLRRARQALARQHTWEVRAAEFLQIVTMLAGDSQPGHAAATTRGTAGVRR